MENGNKILVTALNNDGVQHTIEYDNESNQFSDKALCGIKLKNFDVNGENTYDNNKCICENCKQLKEEYNSKPQIKGLIVKEPWIDLILEGKKTWEIRNSNTSNKGTIALIKSGTGMIYGTVDVIDSKMITEEEYFSNNDKHCIPLDQYITTPYPKNHAWVLSNPVKFKEPIPYKHPLGAVIWVRLDKNVLDNKKA